MRKYIKQLRSFFEEQPRCFGDVEGESVLEILYYCYSSEKQKDETLVRYQFMKLDDILRKLTLEENNAVFSLTCGLCAATERKAFLDGIRVGACLSRELLQEELPQNGTLPISYRKRQGKYDRIPCIGRKNVLYCMVKWYALR